MIDVFRIGVSINATNGVSSVLSVIQRDLFGLNKAVDLTQGKFDRLKLAVVGAMSAMAGVGILAGIGKVVMAGADVVHQQQLMKSAGMSNKEIAQATAQAWQTTSSVMGTAVVDNLQSIRELRIAFSAAAAEAGGNPAAAGAQAMKYLPLMAQAQMILGANLGAGAQDQVYDYAKGLEMIGATQDPTRFTAVLDGMVRAAEASGGKVTGAGYFSAIKYGRSAALGWNNTFLTDVLPLLIQEYGGGNGGSGGPGTALMSAYQAIVGGHVENKGAAELVRLGLVNPAAVIHTTTGSVKGISPGGVKGSDEFISNPFMWVQDVLMPALKKARMTDPKAVQTEIASLFTNRTAQSMMLAFATQQPRFQGSADLTNQAQGLGAWAGLVNSDLTSNLNAFTTALGNFVKAVGVPMVPMATHALHDLTGSIDNMTLWVSKHPDTAKTLVKIGVAVGSFLAVFGATALITAMGTALTALTVPGAGLIALAAGIAALGAVLPSIPHWLIAMGTGAAAGAAAGSVVPILGTTVGAIGGAAGGLILNDILTHPGPQHLDTSAINPVAPGYQSPLQRLQAAQDAASHLRTKDLTAVHGGGSSSQPFHVIVDNTGDIAKQGAIATTASLSRQSQRPPSAPNFSTPSMTPIFPGMAGSGP